MRSQKLFGRLFAGRFTGRSGKTSEELPRLARIKSLETHKRVLVGHDHRHEIADTASFQEALLASFFPEQPKAEPRSESRALLSSLYIIFLVVVFFAGAFVGKTGM